MDDSFIGEEYFLYLFANPRSGSQKAKFYTDLGFENCTVDLGENRRAKTFVFNVVDPEDCSKGLRRLARK
jgi:hypothetical protein